VLLEAERVKVAALEAEKTAYKQPARGGGRDASLKPAGEEELTQHLEKLTQRLFQSEVGVVFIGTQNSVPS
jgi:hypothetical protein